MKKFCIYASVILLLISTAACGKNTKRTENIHSSIHNTYYDMDSYSAKCSVTAYTQGGKNTYDCDVSFQKKNNEYIVQTKDMKLHIQKDKTTVSRGENSMETSSNENDMMIFVNSFFKSYYESETTSLITSGSKKNDTVLLECDTINPTSAASHMKLWINTESILPEKMQVFDKNGFMNTEITFNEFTFTKEL